ncbi:MAG: hypothetical protein ACREQV_27135 [Candidatus Binatia bacterium]
MMDVKIKFLRFPSTGDHAIVIARGRFDLRVLETLFAKLEISATQLPDCKILIDLQDAVYDLSPLQAYNFVNGLAPNSRLTASKIALVSKPEIQAFDQIFLLCAFLSNSGFPVAVFRDAKEAARWLA